MEKRFFSKIFSMAFVWRSLNWLAIVLALLICINYSKSYTLTVISLGFFLLPASLMFGLTGQLMRAATFSSTVVIIIHLFARMKAHYYKDDLVASDFYVIADSNNWGTLLHYPMAGVAITLFVFILLASFFSHRKGISSCAGYRAGSIVFAVIYGILFLSIRNDAQASNAWVASLPNGQGTFANLVFSSNIYNYKPPIFEGGDTIFLEQSSHLVQRQQPRFQHPDIVVMLQESTVNPALFELPNAHIPELEMFKHGPFTQAQGLLRVHTYGGGTWRSEFDLFSGLNNMDFGAARSSVFYTVTPHLHTSLAKVLKQNGYYTVVLSPFNKSAYHAFPAYQDFGVDEMLQPQDLGYPRDSLENLWDIESSEMMEYAKKILKTRTSKPIFLFLLTMKEHGPYEVNTELRYGLEKATPDIALAHRLSDFFHRLEVLSKATEEFSDYLMNRSRPTIFFYFGDHQPGLESEQVKYATKLPDPEYLTQFVLRDNMKPKINMEFEVFDLSLAGALILDRANLSPGPLFSANINMNRLSQGRLQDYPDKGLLNSYKHYIYHTLAAAGK